MPVLDAYPSEARVKSHQMVIPWFVVYAIELFAWHVLHKQTYVSAQGGPGWHRGRLGADSVYFTPRLPTDKRLPRLRPHRRQHRG